jgi:hypothetical protein
MKKLLAVLGVGLLLFSCGNDKKENQYEYHCKQGVTDTVIVFESQYGLDKITLDSILDELVYSGERVLKNPSTFEMNSLKMWVDTIKDTTFLTINGYKNFKDLKILNTSVSFYGKNLLGGRSDMLFNINKHLIYNNKIININPIEISLDIREEINLKPKYSFQHKHTIDSVIWIDWDTRIFNSNLSSNSTRTMIRNSASVYGNKNRSLSISKNNIKKAINLLETKNGNFSITKDILDKNGFSLVCGSEVTNQYFYYDDYLTASIDAIDKEELIKKLKFILEYVYTDNLKYDKWEVTETKGNLTERYNK